MLSIDTERTRAALPFERVIPALRAAFAGDTVVPTRHVHAIGTGPGAGTTLIMPAWNERHYGVKVINIFPDNGARGLPGLHATYTLYSARTGVPLATLDGDEITVRRTAGAAALGASYLARPDAATLLVLGAGRIAALLPAAMSVVRPIQRVLVWNIRAEGARRLASQLRGQGYDATLVEDLEAAVGQADIVSCATLSTAPLVRGDWLRPGTHLDLIGSFSPTMRETDSACFDGTAVYVDTDEAPAKAGDLLEAFKDGVLAREDILGTLHGLARGTAAGRSDPGRITVFKAVGSALEDLAMASLAYEDAHQAK